MSAHPAPEGYLPNDLGVTWDIAAAEIVADQRRRAASFPYRHTRLARETSPQILSRYGLTSQELRRRTRLLRAARRGDQAARTTLMQRYSCRVWQRADLPGQRQEDH